ncbi:MAG: hypothetical protein IJ794_19425 [Lachnospiraceae bacterium]|nr:hypothetical protein [Lachnospiraceae bacterium]
MKKKVLAVLLLVGTSILALAGCTTRKPKTEETQKEDEVSDKQNENGQREMQEVDMDDMVCYYGCPNSKRVRKLNTVKKRVFTI